MDFVFDHSIELLMICYCLYLIYSFYVQFIKVNKNTSEKLLDAYVELLNKRSENGTLVAKSRTTNL